MATSIYNMKKIGKLDRPVDVPFGPVGIPRPGHGPGTGGRYVETGTWGPGAGEPPEQQPEFDVPWDKVLGSVGGLFGTVLAIFRYYDKPENERDFVQFWIEEGLFSLGGGALGYGAGTLIEDR